MSEDSDKEKLRAKGARDAPPEPSDEPPETPSMEFRKEARPAPDEPDTPPPETPEPEGDGEGKGKKSDNSDQGDS